MMVKGAALLPGWAANAPLALPGLIQRGFGGGGVERFCRAWRRVLDRAAALANPRTVSWAQALGPRHHQRRYRRWALRTTVAGKASRAAT